MEITKEYLLKLKVDLEKQKQQHQFDMLACAGAIQLLEQQLAYLNSSQDSQEKVIKAN